MSDENVTTRYLERKKARDTRISNKAIMVTLIITAILAVIVYLVLEDNMIRFVLTH